MPGAAITPINSAMPTHFHRIPDSSNTKMPAAPINSAVPRSGCLAVRAAGTAIMARQISTCVIFGGITFCDIGPTSNFLAYADYGVIYRFMPRTVDRTEMEVIWLVRGEGREVVVDTGFSAAVAKRRGRDHLRCPAGALSLLSCSA